MDDINLCSAPISISFHVTVWCFTRFIQKKTNNPFFSVVFFNFDFESPKQNPPHLLLKLSELVFRLYKPNESNQRNNCCPNLHQTFAGLTWDPGSPGGATGWSRVRGADERGWGGHPNGGSRRSISIGAGVQGGATKRTPDRGGGWRWRDGGDQQKMMGGWEFCWMEFCLDGLFFGLMEILYVNN